jgi:cyclopropane fatty-acyl-phospholipid synthase-like methyltransferase
MLQDVKQQPLSKHQAGVDWFYGSGIDDYHNYHNGYLNFGLWDRPGMTYEQAAENLIARLCTLLGLNAESALLDIGCGMGTQDIFMHRTYRPALIQGLDVTVKHVARATERQRRENVPESAMRFRHGSGTEIPFPPSSFSHVLSVEAPEHFDTREKFFHEAFRVLRPGGVLSFSDYPLARQPKNLFEKFVVWAASRIWHVPPVNIYGNEVFKQKLEAAGFKNVSIANVGALTIPPYYFEHRRPESVREIRKVRGFWKGVVGGYLIDIGVYGAFKLGLCEYNLVRAEKPV